MPPETLHWSLPDATLVSDVRGDNPDTLFLHGFGGSRSDWDPVWTHLDPALSILRHDLRGFGQSDAHGDTPFSHADDLLALLDAQDIARANLVGISMGGGIALQFALDHPDRVRRLILISPGLMGWDWSDDWRIQWRAMTSLAREGDWDGARQLWFDHPLFVTTRAKPQASAWLSASIARYSGAEWIADHQRPVLPDVERLHLLATPTLLLTGEHDLPDFRLIADLIMGSAPHVERIDLTGFGHMLTLETPAACAQAITSFLARD
ncbi:alpha/beta hydrolase [Sphingobium sufflavum]|uniref:alpha/beta fold hydrolase n=1 Tax=Sphingobium sufflavum TaxID=1129547 RepID=UPI001F3C60B5|nr:alpha/beta hydrolase [Sphingobium sufflavum]MCE7798556.1 alpha/beta hydrolase [Sphingobium sufflavum]